MFEEKCFRIKPRIRNVNPLGASTYQKTSDSKRPQTKDSEQEAICIIHTRSTRGTQLSEDLRFKASADQRLGTGAIQSC